MNSQQLSDDWAAWLALNVQRGCAPRDLLRDMKAGGISEVVAIEAIAKLRVDTAEVPLTLPALDPHTPNIVAMLERPQICVIDDFLSAAECTELIALGTDLAQPSAVVDATSGGATLHAARRGSMAFMSDAQPTIRGIKARIATCVRWPIDRFEDLQVIGYRPGDEYQAHFDWFNDDEFGAAAHLANGGQRTGTFLIYLDAPQIGGATVFPRASGFRVHPKAGRAVWFRNIDEYGEPDHLTLHAGEPVIAGVKHVCTAWLRTCTFTAR